MKWTFATSLEKGVAAVFNLLGKFLSLRPITDLLVKQAKKRPYFHITNPDGSGEVYMERYWLIPLNRFVPAVRIHIIKRPDSDRHLHDHPFNFRTFVLDGMYTEERSPSFDSWHHLGGIFYNRRAGDTYKLDHKSFHRIDMIRKNRYDGVVSLFVCGKYQHRWGFLTEQGKIDYDKYLGIERCGSDAAN